MVGYIRVAAWLKFVIQYRAHAIFKFFISRTIILRILQYFRIFSKIITEILQLQKSFKTCRFWPIYVKNRLKLGQGNQIWTLVRIISQVEFKNWLDVVEFFNQNLGSRKKFSISSERSWFFWKICPIFGHCVDAFRYCNIFFQKRYFYHNNITIIVIYYTCNK